MAEGHLQGIPTLVPFDRPGQTRARPFAQVSDLAPGVQIMELLLDEDA